MNYICLDPESSWREEEVFTLGDYYEAMGFDVSNLGTDINRPADMPPSLALALVNKWNREANGTNVYFLEENPAWL